MSRNSRCCDDLGFHGEQTVGARTETGSLEGQGRVEALPWSKWLDSGFMKAELELLGGCGV